MSKDRRSWATEPVGKLRVLVLSVAVVVVFLNLWVAATTLGTNDVLLFERFATGVRKVGPINIYGLHRDRLYNHPPLIGWMLLVMNHLVRLGFSFPFLIPVPARLPDLVTTPLIFSVLPARRRLRPP